MSSELDSTPPNIDLVLLGSGLVDVETVPLKRKNPPLSLDEVKQEEGSVYASEEVVESQSKADSEEPPKKRVKKAKNAISTVTATPTSEDNISPTLPPAPVPVIEVSPAIHLVHSEAEVAAQQAACREHEVAALCAQFGSQTDRPSPSDSPRLSASSSSQTSSGSTTTPAALRAKQVQHIQEFDWKRSLLFIRPADSTLDFRRIQRCASMWCLEEQIQKLVADFNLTESEESLIEFSRLHQQFLRVLTLHLNQFWAIITGSAKVVLAERISVPCSDSSSTSANTADRASSSSSSKSKDAAAAGTRTDFVLRTKSCFRDAHADKSIKLWRFQPSKRGIGEIVLSSESLVDLWMASLSRRACTSVVFDPSESVSTSAARKVGLQSGSTLNLWGGFRITHEKAIAAGKKAFIHNIEQLRLAIAPFLDHIRSIWCRSDEELYLYVLRSLASMVQRPWFKLGVAIVLIGEEGAGKGIIVTEFIAKIIGSYHYSHVTGLSSVCGSFNGSALATACVVFIDESSTGSKLDAAKLKTLITEPTHVIVNKYMPAVEVKSFTNFILSSNSERAVEIDPKGRRFCVLQPDNRFCGTQQEGRDAYFKKLLAVSVDLVAMFLYQVDLTGFDPRQVPATEIQRTQKRLSMEKNGVDLWLLSRIEAGVLPSESSSSESMQRLSHQWYTVVPWEGRRLKAAVYEHYRAQAGSNPKSTEAFWKQLRAIIPYRTIQQKASYLQDAGQVMCFPSLDECKVAFRNYMADPKWSFEDPTVAQSEGLAMPATGSPANSEAAENRRAAAASASMSVPAASGGHCHSGRFWIPPPTGPFRPLDSRPSFR